VPRHDWLFRLLEELGRPLVATSANRSGHLPCVSLEPAYREFAAMVGLAVDGGILECGIASTAVSLEARRVRILRQGTIPETEILQALAPKTA